MIKKQLTTIFLSLALAATTAFQPISILAADNLRTEKWMQQLPDRVYKIYREIAERRTQNDAFALIQENFQKNKVYLHEYFPTIHTVFDDILESYFGRYF